VVLSEGQVIDADFLPGRARIKKSEPRQGFTLLEVVLEKSGEFRSMRLKPSQLEQVKVLHRDTPVPSDPELFFLFTEAKRIRLAHQFDPHLAVGVSQVDPLPHQMEAVYRHALQMPRLRFLIADDPGAGKTIMAGLILKEMQYRGLVERAIIVAPGHLKFQWQREMKERFGVHFRTINREIMNTAWGENVWEEYPLTITSIDFLKQDEIKSTLAGASWDLVIVDEAHKMSAYAYRSKKTVKTKKTKRYQAGEVLSRQTDHLLFLTATPHRGDPDNFRLFLDLLRPGFFAKPDSLEESIKRKDNPLMIRRLKEQMRRFDGSRIFPDREVKTVRFRMTDEEIDLYNRVTAFVQHYFNRATENRQVTFAMMILQRRLTSSVQAIYSSLQRRKDKLQEYLDLPEKIHSDDRYQQAKTINYEEIEDLPEDERWQIEEKLSKITIAENIEDVKAEIQELDKLIEQAEQVQRQEIESKLVALRDQVLNNLHGQKLLIFTEHKDTLKYLVAKLSDWGFDVNYIHGGMHPDARVEAEHVFKENTQILVATEAAGEGINLQFCSLMVNYDIPWNPNRLEQRMGRIHRYGQKDTVHIWNMVSKDTREGQLLDRLFDKLNLMRRELGDDRVFDIIGEIIPGKNLDQLLKDAIFHQHPMEEGERTLDGIQSDYTRQVIDQVFLNSLATPHIDVTSLQQDQLRSQGNRLIPEYVEDFFLRGFKRLGGRYSRSENGYRIESVPYEMRQLNDDPRFKAKYGRVHHKYKKIAFDKQIAYFGSDYEFVAPGHPLLESLNENILSEHDMDGRRYAVFLDPEGAKEGVIWFVLGSIRDGTGKIAGERIFCILQDTAGNLQQLNPAVLWDFTPCTDTEIPGKLAEHMKREEDIEDYVVCNLLGGYHDEMDKRRAHDAAIKERYGLESLDYLIQESNQKLLDYDQRQDQGEDMKIATVREERRLKNYEDRREELKREISLEKNLTMDSPKIMGVAVILAAAPGQPESGPLQQEGETETQGGSVLMRSDENIEAIGMQVSIKYEETNGWEVTDVSEAKHGGFDLRSIKIDEEGKITDVRYIEVKARARTGEIRLSANEWKKARQLKDEYWLYVVTDAGTEQPQLQRIQDPAGKLEQEKDIYATGYRIPEDRWQEIVAA
jgi:superfamily II DNA or RNA helicase